MTSMLILMIHESVKIPNIIYPSTGHVVTGNLKIFPHSRNRYIVSKGPKYIFPSHIDFNRRIKEIASTLNAFGNRWCKRECHIVNVTVNILVVLIVLGN